jgi:hypothetical protein
MERKTRDITPDIVVVFLFFLVVLTSGNIFKIFKFQKDKGI